LILICCYTSLKPAQALSVDKDVAMLDASRDYTILDNGQTPWLTYTVNWQVKQPSTLSYGLSIHSVSRFNKSDTGYAIFTSLPIKDAWRLDANLAFTPGAQVIRKQAIEFWSRHAMSQGWGIAAGISVTAYPSDNTNDISSQTLMAEVEKYHRNFRFSYRLVNTHIVVPGVTQRNLLTHVISAALYHTDRDVVSVFASSGSELENNGTSNPPISEVQSLSLDLRYGLSRAWTLLGTLGTQRQGELYIRQNINLGLRYVY